jgi:predicted membrane-bound spermidine synthase
MAMHNSKHAQGNSGSQDGTMLAGGSSCGAASVLTTSVVVTVMLMALQISSLLCRPNTAAAGLIFTAAAGFLSLASTAETADTAPETNHNY